MKNSITLEDAQRFYDTLAKIVGNKEDVIIRATVTLKEEEQHSKQGEEVCKETKVS